VATDAWLCWDWVGDHTDEIGAALRQHVELTVVAVFIGMLISAPLSLLAWRHRRTGAAILSVTGILYTIPSLALFGLLIPFTGLTFATAEIALVGYTLLVIIRNVLAGLDGVPDDVRESARGMGLTATQQLLRVELPHAARRRLGAVARARGRRRRAARRPAAPADAVATRGGGPMTFWRDVFAWFTTGATWSGPEGITHRLSEHVVLSASAVAIALVLALPIGLVLGHLGRGGFLAVNVSNIGRAVPSFAILVIAQQITRDIGTKPALIALVALAVPPIVTNTYVGMRAVDEDVVESARGMGMTGRQILTRVEAPLAMPVIMAGIRTAAVQVVATATLAALIAGGGLGRFIIDGFAQQDNVMAFGGALLVALLAVVTELTLGFVQRRVTPGGTLNARPVVAEPGPAGGVAALPA
jgi:osmoprotectant transport system permease protein